MSKCSVVLSFNNSFIVLVCVLIPRGLFAAGSKSSHMGRKGSKLKSGDYVFSPPARTWK